LQSGSAENPNALRPDVVGTPSTAKFPSQDSPTSLCPIYGPERPPDLRESSINPKGGKQASVENITDEPTPQVKTSKGKNLRAGISSSRKIDKASPRKAKPKSRKDKPPSEFRLRVAKEFWPAFDPGEVVLSGGNLQAGGSLFYNFVDGLHGHWGRGGDVGPIFGRPMFHSERPLSDDEDMLPARLFDLVQQRVVMGAEVGKVRYACVSHVWGRTRDIDGAKYGVNWKIPISSEEKLGQILTAARVVIGERYIWLDVLCKPPIQMLFKAFC
jgi:hypothetical protein